MFTGSLSNLYFLKEPFSIATAINFKFPEIYFPNEKIYFKKVAVKSELLDKRYSIKITSVDVQNEEDEYLARGVSASFPGYVYDPQFIEKMKLKINRLFIPPSPFLDSGELIDLSISFSNKNNLDYGLLADGKFIEGDLMANDFPFIKLGNLNFKVSSTYLLKSELSSELTIDVAFVSESDHPFRLNAELTAEVSNNNLFNCMQADCPVSDLALIYDIIPHKESMTGVFSCSKLPCNSVNTEHSIKTTDTVLFFESASASGVFNPIFLAFLYRNLLTGEKIGEGHLFRF